MAGPCVAESVPVPRLSRDLRARPRRRRRLHLTADEMPGGHLVALSRPQELADRLEAYAAQPDRKIS